MRNNLGAAKRLRKELQCLEKAATNGDSDVDIFLRPTSPSSLLHWTALIKGPIDTPYEGGVFKLSIRCGSDYPLSPPTITFDTKVFHPNVHFSKGDVCLDILKKEWSPAWGLQAACRAVLALLSDPDAESPLNCDVSDDDDDSRRRFCSSSSVIFYYSFNIYTYNYSLNIAGGEHGEGRR